MTEHLSSPITPERHLIENPELAHLGALLVEASMREDLNAVVAQHTADTGTANPNTIGSSGLFVAGEVPMANGNVYRQVGIEAVEDLATSGIVRNGATAQGESHPRWGNRVFWHPGDSNKQIQTGGRLIIEADKTAAESGWVTADNVQGVYARDNDGLVKNLL